MKRKLFVTGLAIALALCMAVPALATESAPPDSAAGTAEGAAGTPEVEIDVEVPTKVEFTLNPYHMPVETSEGRRYDTVVCIPQTFASRTAAPLLVTVTFNGAPRAGSDLSLAASPNEFDPNCKTAFLWYEFVDVMDGQEPVWSGEYTGARNQVALNDESGAVLELPASVDGEPVLTAFRAFGMLGVPSEGMWTDVDCVDASISLHFDVIEDDDATLYGVTSETLEDDEAVDVTDDAKPTIGEPPKSMDVDDEASDVDETVDAVDEASDVDETVDAVDDVADLVKPMIAEPPKPIDTDDASDIEEPTIGEPPIPMDVDDASDVDESVDEVEEPVDEVDEVEEPVDEVDDDEASDVDESVDEVEEPVDEVDEVEEPIDEVDDDEASDDDESVDEVEEPVDDVDEASDVDESVDEVEEVEEPVDEVDEAEEPVDEVDDVEEDAKRPEEEEPVEEEQVSEDA